MTLRAAPGELPTFEARFAEAVDYASMAVRHVLEGGSPGAAFAMLVRAADLVPDDAEASARAPSMGNEEILRVRIAKGVLWVLAEALKRGWAMRVGGAVVQPAISLELDWAEVARVGHELRRL